MIRFLVFISLSLFSLPLLVAQKNFTFLSNLQYPTGVNDIWAYEDTQGNSYALVGTEQFTSIVDVTNPNQITELHRVYGDTSVWRDLKTYNNFAYVTNEEGGGLLIIDLIFLPDSIHFQNISAIDTFDLQTAHNLFIDENGVAYVVGSNIANQGVFMLDVNTPNRYQPEFLGLYDDTYVHDCYVRGDTLWTSEIWNGEFGVVDVSDKANPQVLARFATSSNYTHNCWLSPNGEYLATTDEKANAAVDMIAVGDLNNIEILDSYKSSLGFDVIPHNTFFKGNNYLFTSYYRDGVTLVDATRKDNLVEVGNFDTSPFISADGFEGAWGVYPYLPNDIILVSDREEGLFVLQVSYSRAAYLEGNITDGNTGLPVADAQVEVMGTSSLKPTNFLGDYKTGVADSGLYNIRITHPFCQTVIVPNVLLENEVVNVLDTTMICDYSVAVSNNLLETNVSTYPNPTKDWLHFTYEGNFEMVRVHIYDATGKTVARYQLPENQQQYQVLCDWKSGVYIAEMQFDNQKIYRKIIKE